MTINLSPAERDPSRIVTAIRQMAQGNDNANGVVTLTVSSSTTTVSAPNCSSTSKPFLFPASANAGAEAISGNLFIASTFQGGFVISHTNTTVTARTFNWITRG